MAPVVGRTAYRSIDRAPPRGPGDDDLPRRAAASRGCPPTGLASWPHSPRSDVAGDGRGRPRAAMRLRGRRVSHPKRGVAAPGRWDREPPLEWGKAPAAVEGTAGRRGECGRGPRTFPPVREGDGAPWLAVAAAPEVVCLGGVDHDAGRMHPPVTGSSTWTASRTVSHPSRSTDPDDAGCCRRSVRAGSSRGRRGSPGRSGRSARYPSAMPIRTNARLAEAVPLAPGRPRGLGRVLDTEPTGPRRSGSGRTPTPSRRFPGRQSGRSRSRPLRSP